MLFYKNYLVVKILYCQLTTTNNNCEFEAVFTHKIVWRCKKYMQYIQMKEQIGLLFFLETYILLLGLHPISTFFQLTLKGVNRHSFNK